MSRLDELTEEEFQKAEAARVARARGAARSRAGYRLRMELEAARPLEEHAALLGPDHTLLGLVWPDCPDRHRLGGDPVSVKAPWKLLPDGVYRTFPRLRRSMPVVSFEAINLGVMAGPSAVDGLYDYRICSPCWPLSRPGRGRGWRWLVKTGGVVKTAGWKTVEVPVFDDRGEPVDLVSALGGHGVKFNSEPARVTSIGAMTGDKDERAHTARQIFSELIDHIGGQVL